jgi:hypothetical protein
MTALDLARSKNYNGIASLLEGYTSTDGSVASPVYLTYFYYEKTIMYHRCLLINFRYHP